MKKRIITSFGLLFAFNSFAGVSFCRFSGDEFNEYKEQFCDKSSSGKLSLNEEKIAAAFNIPKDQVTDLFGGGFTLFGGGPSKSDILVNLQHHSLNTSVRTQASDLTPQQLNAQMRDNDRKITNSESVIGNYEVMIDKKMSFGEFFETIRSNEKARCLEAGEGDLQSCGIKAEAFARENAESEHAKYQAELRETQQEVDTLSRTLATQEQVMKESKEKFKKGYGKRFSDYAVQQLNAVNGIDGVDSIEDVQNICFGEDLPSAAESICEKIIADAEKFNGVNEGIDKHLKKLRDAKTPLDLLSMKIDKKLLESDATKSEILKEAEAGLEGTVIGEMMNQMREDMCSLAQNPDMQCTGVVDARSAYINDAANILKQLQPETPKQRQQTSEATAQ